PTGGKLDIRIGQVIESTTAYFINSSGTLHMSPGTLYQIAKGSADSTASNADLIPRMNGVAHNYVLTGGTIELAGNSAGNYFQTLRGTVSRPNYYNLKFSGFNTYLSNYKNISSATTVDNNVYITDNAIVDLAHRSMTGNAGLTMDGGRLRISQASSLVYPQILGIATDYAITGGTFELYGSTSSGVALMVTKQIIRGIYGTMSNPKTVSWHNIEVNAISAKLGYQNANVGSEASFGLTGTMNVNSPSVFKLDRTDIISGIGSFNIQPGSTFKYGNNNGITTAGASGNIQVTGTRSFPSTASYGFTSTANMESGNGLPTNVVNIYLEKSGLSDKVTLTDNITIGSIFDMDRGNIVVKPANLLELGTGTTYSTKGRLEYNTTDEPFVIGQMKRWFHTNANLNDSTGLFPLGDTTSAVGNDIHNRFAKSRI
ncbi:MAG: hypothetical protein R2728_16505, partial [Chitinophagales bacterium]